MQTLYIFLYFFMLIIFELVYFAIATRYNIIDKPNQRSSHTAATIRGGGIIFAFSVFAFYTFEGFNYSYFTFGLFCISLISFLDDILTLSNKLRILIHVLAVFMLIFQWNLLDMPLWISFIFLIFIIAIINAYNFMDGINGLTGLYSLITVTTLYFINKEIILFFNSKFFVYIILSLVVFILFNFRTKAKCFAGDVGSISISFIILFILGTLILKTGNFIYILLLLVYGLDAVSTIVFRLIRRENIFESHRSHFYQFLANEKKLPHLVISAGYALTQLLVNCFLVKYFLGSIILSFIFVLLTSLIFIIIRFNVEGKEQLLVGK